jgi:5-formyltetrahydrofolate cyclo-ligase
MPSLRSSPRRRALSNYNARMDTAPIPSESATIVRARMRETRARLGAPARIAAAEGVAAALEQLPEFVVDANVAGYWAVGGELPLHVVVARLRSRGQRYLLPVLTGKVLRFAPLLPNAELRANRHAIPEPVCAEHELLGPAQLDLVLVPLTAFDRRGGRIGMGGGYYDRSFAFLRDAPRPAQPLLVGIGYSFQEVDALPAQAHDLAMDFIATEKELISCATGNPAPLS